MTQLQKHLESIGACASSIAWSRDMTPEEAWSKCTRPDWLLEWAARTPVNSATNLAKAALLCAREVLHLVTPGIREKLLRVIVVAEVYMDNPSPETAESVETGANAAREIAWRESDLGDEDTAEYVAVTVAWAAEAALGVYQDRSIVTTAVELTATWFADATLNAENSELCDKLRSVLVLPYRETK